MNYNVERTGTIIKDLRTEKKEGQEKVANEMGINIKTYQAAEQGKRGVSIDTLCIIADYYDVSLDYLVTGKRGNDFAWSKLLESVPEDKKEQLYQVVFDMINMFT